MNEPKFPKSYAEFEDRLFGSFADEITNATAIPIPRCLQQEPKSEEEGRSTHWSPFGGFLSDPEQQ